MTFLLTIVATSVTGFFFPNLKNGPPSSSVVGVVQAVQSSPS
ncbi:MAG: hypothetical protein Q8M19_10955 [Reyranella sp.]|nr:hypothetical protein [Reyranella sp.]